MKQTPSRGRKFTDKLSVGLPGQLGQSESAIAKGMYPRQLLSAEQRVADGPVGVTL